MTQPFQAVPVTDRVHWVGAIDWGIRNFHGYLTSRGTSYNAYLVMADDPILVDTVKAPFQDEMLARIASVTDPARIRTVVSNHAEMDHSAGLPAFVHRFRPERVLASKQGAKALRAHFHWDREVQQVSDGERVAVGGVSLRFFETRMLHWPDSMFCHLEDEGVLFSQDAFGMHLASSERFADELDQTVLRHEAAKYYANILLPFSPQVSKLLEKLPSLNLDIRILAPDHGPIFRQAPGQMLDLYAQFATQRPTKKAVVVYDTMWQSTARMARSIGDGLAEAGLSVKLLPLESSHRSDVATEILDAGALLVGSPTMNNQLFPTVADVMTYLKGLRPKNLVGAAFGSYGWSGGATKHLEKMLQEMGVELAGESLRVQYVPDPEALSACQALGVGLARKLMDRFSIS